MIYGFLSNTILLMLAVTVVCYALDTLYAAFFDHGDFIWNLLCLAFAFSIPESVNKHIFPTDGVREVSISLVVWAVLCTVFAIFGLKTVRKDIRMVREFFALQHRSAS